MDGLKLTATHIKTCYPDDLDCHNHGTNTLLISANMVTDHDESMLEMVDALSYACNGYTADYLPFVPTEIESALCECFYTVVSSDYITELEYSQCMVYVLLDWCNHDD
jgi:hypothetical protein